MAEPNEVEEKKGGSSIQDVTVTKPDGAANSSRPILKFVNEGIHAGTSLLGQAASVVSNPFLKNKRSVADPSSSTYTASKVPHAQREEFETTPSSSRNPSADPISTYYSSKESIPVTKSESQLTQTSTLILGPISEFLFRDSTLLMIIPSLAVTTYLVQNDWCSVSDGLVSTQVCASLVVLAFLFGRETAKVRAGEESVPESKKSASSKVVSFDDENQIISPFRRSIGKSQGMRTHAFFRSLCGNLAKVNINFGPQVGIRMSRDEMKSTVRSSLQKIPSGRTTPKPFWKENLDRSSDLVQSMLKNPKFKRSGRSALLPSRSDDEDEIDSSEMSDPPIAKVKGNIDGKGSVQLGPIDFDRAQTTKRKGDGIIEPLFHLRGIDIFLTTDGNPQEKIWELQALKEVGLRTKPTFCINCLLPWSNFVAYFAMPNWFVDTTSSLEVKEGDTPDEIALKRFLKASSEQKTNQFSLRPCLVEGPLPIRMMASPGEEYEVGSDYLPMQWHLVEGRGNNAPLLGLDVDCTSDKALRTVASLAKRYLYSVSIDVGVVIENDDVACCLGLFRMDKIDTKMCPELPEHTVEEDLHRASAIMLSSSRTQPAT